MPLSVLGFAPPAVYAYLVFVSFLAVFIHANVRFDLTALDWVLVTPRFHHWHHAASPVDKNFAVHLPWIDRLFGTAPARLAVPPRTARSHLVVPSRVIE